MGAFLRTNGRINDALPVLQLPLYCIWSG